MVGKAWVIQPELAKHMFCYVLKGWVKHLRLPNPVPQGLGNYLQGLENYLQGLENNLQENS